MSEVLLIQHLNRMNSFTQPWSIFTEDFVSKNYEAADFLDLDANL